MVGNHEWRALSDCEPKHVLTREECKRRGLYVNLERYRVDLAKFREMHPVETEDGRRFCTVDCALSGTMPLARIKCVI